jgi:hypothetical protein
MRALVPPALLLLCSCRYLGERGEDFLDIWRADLHLVGIPGAWVHAGPLAHVGLGSSRPIFHDAAPGPGFIYNLPDPATAGESDFYLLLLHSSSNPDHKCIGLLPGVLHEGDQDRAWIHLFDLEVGAGFILGGTSIGFSPGQFLDFLLGWFGLDLGGDDTPEGRKARRLRPYQIPRPKSADPLPLGSWVELTAEFGSHPVGSRGEILERRSESEILLRFSGGDEALVPVRLLQPLH